MTGPRLVQWNQPSGKCQGCAGCSIQRALAERDTFARGEVAHLLALAFRSGAQLAHDMAEDITRWATDPVVVKSATAAYRTRRAAIDAGAARWETAKTMLGPVGLTAGIPAGLDQDDIGAAVDPDVEWPEVTPLGGSDGAP